MSFAFLLLTFQPDSPIIVRVVEPAKESGLKEVVLGSLGLTGVIALVAVISGLVLAGVLLWIRSRSA